MEQTNNNSRPEGAETGPATARIRRTPWRGWLMAVPLAAMILVAYLVVRTWVFAGPTVTVTFPHSAGISAPGTVVKYKGMRVGHVTSVDLVDDLRKVQATLQLRGSVADAVNDGTKFWIVSPSLLNGDIQSLVSGPYIAMRPGKGANREHFKGRLHPPRRPDQVSGRIVTLTTADKGLLGRGSLVLYHGIQAGRILTTDYDANKDRVEIRALIKHPFAKKLTDSSRFWRAGGFNIGTGSGAVNIKTPRPQALVSGAIAFGNVAQSQPQNGHTGGDKKTADRYPLYDGQTAARSALAGPHRRFSLTPTNGLDGISTGAPVTLEGQKIGRVSAVRMRYDPSSKRIQTGLDVTIYARALGIGGQTSNNEQATAKNNATARLVNALSQLVSNGLRAKISANIPVVGGKHIELAMVGQKDAQGLDHTQDPPAIPMVAGGGIGDIMDKIGDIASKLDAVPIARIGQNVAKTTENAQQIASSPQIRQALSNLNHSLANVEDVTANANGQIKPTLESLREAAAEADNTLRQIKQVTGGPASNQANVQQLVGEVTRASRSIRALTSYLQQHPDALLRGREQ
ncbi:PqiB family protein [Salinisphaera orenii]|uniref:PqiB family protein n=1 Tax=Salinisphaera orenii TaxID=856731 RepID=UPI000DBE48EE